MLNNSKETMLHIWTGTEKTIVIIRSFASKDFRLGFQFRESTLKQLFFIVLFYVIKLSQKCVRTYAYMIDDRWPGLFRSYEYNRSVHSCLFTRIYWRSSTESNATLWPGLFSVPDMVRVAGLSKICFCNRPSWKIVDMYKDWKSHLSGSHIKVRIKIW